MGNIHHFFSNLKTSSTRTTHKQDIKRGKYGVQNDLDYTNIWGKKYCKKSFHKQHIHIDCELITILISLFKYSSCKPYFKGYLVYNVGTIYFVGNLINRS